MDVQSVSGLLLTRRQFAQTLMAFVGGASVFSNPSLRWLTRNAAPGPQTSRAGILLFADAADGQAQGMAERFSQNGLLVVVSTADSPGEAREAVDQFMAHPQLGGHTIGVIGVGAGTVQVLQLAHSHPALGAAVLIGGLPDNADWQSDFALLQQRGARTLILPGALDESVLGQVERFVRQFAV